MVCNMMLGSLKFKASDFLEVSPRVRSMTEFHVDLARVYLDHIPWFYCAIGMSSTTTKMALLG